MAHHSTYVVYDLETGGLDPETDAITEIAMIAVDGDTLEEVGRIERLIQPYDANYTKEAEDVSGITKDMLYKVGMPREDVFDDICGFLELHKKNSSKPVLVGHNIKKFDNLFLEAQLFKPIIAPGGTNWTSFSKTLLKHSEDNNIRGINRQLSKIKKIHMHKYVSDAYVDTLELARHFMQDLTKHTLTLSCASRGIKIEEAHRAMADTEANAKLFISLMKSGRSNGLSKTVKKRRDTFYL